MVEKFNASLAQHFNLVVWDQRGAGLSYYPFTASNHPTIDTYLEDIHELTLQLLDRFHQDKIYLIGHSWGSVLGVKFIQAHPELVHHYIGCGQVVSMKAVTAEQIAFVRTRTKDAKTLTFLDNYDDAIAGQDWVKTLLKLNKLVIKHGGSLYGRSNMNNLIWPFLTCHRYSVKELLNRQKGSMQSVTYLWHELMETDFTNIHRFDIPVTFCEGRRDYHVSSSVAHDWYETIDSPRNWHWFEHSGHFPQWEEPDRFHDIILQEIAQ
ncbi:putative aminopeptidase YbaC [Bombiscardovia apis]|uniref:Aminopeptidase YbaC n=1 Tax=Bombiscardovia apis TaxID=2932182 RepID=A0ABN6SG51_9BIFI|nr:putative aminopeptidase YbaC [Bombiscardovia apis]